MFKYLRFLFLGFFHILANALPVSHFAKNPAKYPSSVRFKRVKSYIHGVCGILKPEYHVEGLENLPKEGNVLYIANHQSNMDPIMLVDIVPNPIAFVAKKETQHFPFVASVVRALDSVFMDRKNIRSELASIGQVGQKLSQVPNQSFVIFPEGTRSRDVDHQVADFKPGALKPAFMAQTPIVPIAIYGGYRCLDKHLVMKRYPIQIKILPPVSLEDINQTNTVDLAKKLHGEIVSEVDKMRQKDKELAEENLKHKNQNPYISGL